MPQLDLSSFASQAFWVILCFGFLWGMLAIFITPKIADIKEQRKRNINEYIMKAEELNLQAKKSLAKYREALAEAKKTAEFEMQKGKEELINFLKDQEQKSHKELNKKIAENDLILAKEKKEALLKVEKIAEDLAFEIVQKLGFSSISKQDIKNSKKEKAYE